MLLISKEIGISLIELFVNNSYNSSIFIAPFQEHYVRRCRSPVRFLEVEMSSLLDIEIVFENIVNFG